MRRYTQIALLVLVTFAISLLPVYQSVSVRAQDPQPTSELTYTSNKQLFSVNLVDGTSTSKGDAPPEPNVVDNQNHRFWIDNNGDVGFFRIMQSDTDGSAQKVLLTSDQFYAQFPDFNEHPYELALSTDQTMLFFDPRIGDEIRESCYIFSLNITTGAVTNLNFSAGWNVTGIAPDGNRAVIGYKTYYSEGGTYFPSELVKQDQTGNYLNDVAASDVAWLDDGRFIYSVMSNDDWGVPPDADAKAHRIVLADKDGNKISDLVTNVLASELALSPDQKQLAYVAYDTHELWLINIDGSGNHKVGDVPADTRYLEWRNTGNQCTGAPISCLKITITKLDDKLNGTIYPSNNKSTVDGNNVTATIKVEYLGSETISGELSLALPDGVSDRDVTFPRPIDMPNFSGSEEKTISFSTLGMAWGDNGILTATRKLVAKFRVDSVSLRQSEAISFGIRPRPVILVHGWNDTADSWKSYLKSDTGFLPSIGINLGASVDNLDTGGGGWFGSKLDLFKSTVDSNAEQLRKFINQKKKDFSAEQVDIVAHSMGGIITRRYINKYMDPHHKDIHQLIMLGTPNGGVFTAHVITIGQNSLTTQVIARALSARYAALLELTPEFMSSFNRNNPKPDNIPFYEVAGNYDCPAFFRIPDNPIEIPYPNDIIVSRASALLTIKLDKGWTFPGASLIASGCNGDHRGMRDTEPGDGGQSIFDLYVSPLLRGLNPDIPSELQVTTAQNSLQTTDDSVSAMQLTDVQTGTLLPGNHLEFSRTPEQSSTNTYNFIVVGQPDQMTVSLRDPNGRIIMPSTTDPQVKYMQMDQDFLPITSYTINNPVLGTWTTIIDANAQTPSDGMSVAVLGSLVSDLRLTTPVGANTPQVNHSITIMAELRTSDIPILGANVSAVLVDQGGTTTPVTLLDDGQSGDSTGNDGVYSYQFIPKTSGVYNAVISASGNVGSIPFNRSGLWVKNMEGSQIFLPIVQKEAIAPSDLTPTPTDTTVPGTTPTVTNTSAPVETPTLTSTSAPLPSDTPSITATAPATPTNTPTSTSTPTPTNTSEPVVTSIDIPISSDTQDGYEDTSFHISGDSLHDDWIGTEPNIMAGWVFTNLHIPQGAKITSAYVRFRGFGNGGDATAQIKAFAEGNAANFTSDGSNKPSARPATTAFVDWSNTWSFQWQWFQTPDLSQLVQEVVKRSDWASGNNIGLSVNNQQGTGTNWSVADYTFGPYNNDDGPGHSVVLHITYSYP